MKFLRRRIRHVLSIVTLLTAWAWLSQSRPLEAEEQKPKSTTTNQQPAAPPPINVTVVAPEKSAAERQQAADEAAEQIAIQRKIADYTGALAVVGALDLIALAVGLIYSVRAANAAKTAGDAAARSATVAEQTLHIAYRARLHIDVFLLTKWGQPAPRLVMEIKNSGLLHATIKSWGAVCLRGGALAATRDTNELIRYPHAGMVGPNEGAVTLDAPVGEDWTPEIWNEIGSGRQPLTIWGVIWYDTGLANLPGELGFAMQFVHDAPPAMPIERRFAISEIPGYAYSK